MLDDDYPLLENKKFANQEEFYAFVKKDIHNRQLYSPVR
jgi:hypothetical protein